jgi:hypothetical protein
MKKFIIKITLFLAIPLFYFGGNMIINYYIYRSQSVIIDNTRMLIAGDSHTQKGLNPDLFENAQNISQTAEPYILTYWKLKNIFKYYQPDTLILGFAPHNISQFNDYKFSNEKWSGEMFKRSYPIENFKSIKNIIPVNHYDFYKTLWKLTAFYPKKTHVNYLGKYSNKKSSDVSGWQSVIKRHYYWNDKVLGVSELGVRYLDSIVKICQQQEIVVVLASHPVYNRYLDKIPPSIMKKYNSLKEKYEGHAIIFEQTQDIAYPDSLFLNADHLNEDGAKRFTYELITYLNNKARKHNNEYKK